MKHAILSATIGLFLITPTFAQTTGGNGNNPGTDIIIKPIPRPTTKPKLPFRQHIECHYDGGWLNVDFTFPEGECEMTVTDDMGGNMTYQFDSEEETSIYIGEIIIRELRISTGHGNEYIGTPEI